jgi:aldehyde:ferredoxin oxidoreductase
MGGYFGTALMVDLTQRTVEESLLPGEWYRDYVGGEGLGARLLLDLVDPEEDLLSENQPLIFTTGSLTGTAAPASGRCAVVFRSPLTGTLGAANAGGHFAPALKKAGYDVLVVTGRAEAPVVLVIDDDGVDFLDASGTWGKGVSATEDWIRSQLEGTGWQIASIGPAGEKGVLFSSIMTDRHRAFGRGGPGALMGSKNFKAIAVRGTSEPPVADPEGLKEAASFARKELMSEAFVRDEMKPYGTPSFYDAICALGILPTRNWQRDSFPESLPDMAYKTYHETLEVRPYACFGCPIACGRHTKIKSGKWAGLEGGGPEYESMAAFGSKCEVKDLNIVAAANHLANDLGLDIISTGQVIATAMEWAEKGILKKEQLGGLELAFGNGDAVVEAVRLIGNREGIGDLLAEGSVRAAERLGPEAKAAVMAVRGMEMAADGVRASKGEAVTHAVSPRGADHLRPYSSTIDAFGYREPELGIEADAAISITEDGNKGWVKPLMANAMIPNLLGTCLFTNITLAIKPSTWANLHSKALGREMGKDELLLAAERVINLERMINATFGFDGSSDTLPGRFLEEPGVDGPGVGQVVDLKTALESFYERMGWDPEEGLPSVETLTRLGLDWMLYGCD